MTFDCKFRGTFHAYQPTTRQENVFLAFPLKLRRQLSQSVQQYRCPPLTVVPRPRDKRQDKRYSIKIAIMVHWRWIVHVLPIEKESCGEVMDTSTFTRPSLSVRATFGCGERVVSHCCLPRQDITRVILWIFYSIYCVRHTTVAWLTMWPEGLRCAGCIAL